MPSIYRRDGSKYFMGAYTDARGKRRARSTKTDDRAQAMKIVMGWDRVAHAARRGTLIESQSRAVISEIHEQVTGRPLRFHSAESWFAEWVNSVSAKPKTIARYKWICDQFVKFLGERAKLGLGAINAEDVRAYRDFLKLGGISARTCNQIVLILRMPFKQAAGEGLIPNNPASVVKPLVDGGAGRQAFTMEQIRMLLAATKDTDWEGCIMLGALAGLRLMDAILLPWSAVDMEAGMIDTITGKRGVRVQVPIHPDLMAWLKNRRRGIGKARVLPNIQHTTGTLSQDFRRIMKRAGIISQIARQGRGKGHTMRTLSFHSTRHFFVSELSASGVALDIRKRLAGHTDERTHAKYAGHEMQSLERAIAGLPRV